MSDAFEGRQFPRPLLIGAALLIGFTIAAAAFVRLTGIGKSETEFAPVVVERKLFFREIDQSTIEVIAEGAPIAVLDSKEDGFIFGVLRGLGHYRKVSETGKDRPYIVSLRASGRLVLEDPTTGEQLDLRAYGVDNAAAFRELLEAKHLDTSSSSAADPATGYPTQPDVPR
ncbi:photosynthetic complex assembly protein PuhC [Thiorhodovibrio frisius]|uniref:Putative photosynthetic complex assembly protein n=1 Tax=Thiorhodovibrio frisius TaxID=631362 RepID=H8Z0X3_9GAMM|nr:photosynthetic complex assembly protein PuhC [Thiorhodovibrio frisius]EIC21355.1 putative photosynthetic complex assembly protein [Thiorhodovibrio frisius]WPL23940.1 putative photosynthetic complex assembly protein [Thiorhodovibrio frisius]